MKKLVLIALINLVSGILWAETSPVNIPDSLVQGVSILCYEVLDNNIKSVDNPKLGKLLNNLQDEQAGLAMWKGNYEFTPTRAPFYVIMRGYLLIKETKSYVFNLQGDDGSKLYLDGKMMIDNDGIHDFVEKHAEIYLEKGLHPYEIRAFNTGTKKAKETSLAWNGHSNEVNAFDWVPKEYLYVSKRKIANSKLNAGEVVESIPDVTIEKGYSNSLHPSFDLYNLHDETFTPKVGGIDFLSNGKLVVCTWDSLGSVFILDNVQSGDPKQIKVKRIAMGLAEPLGLKVVDDKIYVLQKQELTQLIDQDGDEIIDEYKTICNAWGATGNFHEFSFGLVYKDGFFYAALATAINPGGKSTIPQNKDRGKAVKIGMDGSFEVIASGLRTPNGIGIGVDNEIFIADNQGDWLPSCKILHLTKGAFFGSYSVELYDIGKLDEKPPVVWLPQGEIGNSASQPGIMKDGPYAGQMIHGDVTHGGLKRVFVEKIAGEYQGIVFPFSQGLLAGVNRICWGPDGALYIGGIGSNGNWGQYGKKWYGLQKIKFNNKNTFEILAVRAKANGMEIEFTQPLGSSTGNNLLEYDFTQWKYVPTMQYGGPKIDPSKLSVLSASISSDRKRVFVELDGLKVGYVVMISLPKAWKSANGSPIWANKGWYTLNKIPEEKGKVTSTKAKVLPAAKTTAAVTKPVVKELTDKELLAIGPKLIDDSGCLQCHAKDKVILGPSFKMINGKYNADPATLSKLIEKVYKGGSGVWGDQAMGANTHLSKDDIKKMVRYILALPE